MIQSVAIIGKQNNPLYIHNSNLKYDFIAHCCCDYQSLEKNYLGLLFIIEDVSCFGYVTCTGVKFYLLLDTNMVKDSVLIAFFKKLHALYIEIALNPFGFKVGAKFQSSIQELINQGL